MKKSYIIIILLLVILSIILCMNLVLFNEILNPNTNELNNISQDMKFNDPGIESNKNNDWYSTIEIIDVSEKGTSLFVNSNSGYYLANKPNTTTEYLTNTYDWKPPFTVEFDIVDIMGDVILNLEDNANSSSSIHLLSNGAKPGSHVIVNVNKNNVKIHIDENTISRNVTLKNTQVGFKLVSDTSISYKNFVIY